MAKSKKLRYPDVLVVVDATTLDGFSGENISRFRKATDGLCDFQVALHTNEIKADLPADVITQSDVDIFQRLQHKKTIIKGVVPGNWDLKFVDVAHRNPSYQMFFRIEFDVVVSGKDWKTTIDDLIRFSLGKDFVTSYLRNYTQGDSWMWWSSLKYPNRENFRPLDSRAYASFCPIMACSRKFIEAYTKALQNGIDGHGEVTLPTVAADNGLSMGDLASPEARLTSFPQFSADSPRDLEQRIPAFLHPVKTREAYEILIQKVSEITNAGPKKTS